MKEKRLSWSQLFELLATFFLIMIYIWWLRDGIAWIPILMLVVASHLIRGENLNKLGFWPKDLKRCFYVYGERVFVGLIGGLFYAGFLYVLVLGQQIREMPNSHALANLADDICSGFLQQYLLNGYFLNRFTGFFDNKEYQLASWLAAVFFSATHFPNGFLMSVTLWGGYSACLIFLKSGKDRNLYFLAIAHGLIKFLLFLLVPDSVSRNFMVGPRYLN